MPTASLSSPGNQTSAEEGAVSFSVSGSDSAGDPLVYSATNLPPGLNISPTTGLISGSISDFASAGSPYNVTVIGYDSTYNGASSSTNFSWTVNPSVTVVNPGAQTSADGDSVSVGVSATDSAGSALTYSASGLPGGLSIDSRTGIISGTVSSGDDIYS